MLLHAQSGGTQLPFDATDARICEASLVKCHLAPTGAHGQITDISAPFSWNSAEGMLELDTAGHTIGVLHECDTPPWCSLIL